MTRDQRIAGDVARVLRESLAHVRGPVALLTITDGAEHEPGTFARRLRACQSSIRASMQREGERPPRCVARVAQLQGRGAVHAHAFLLCRTPDERARVARWVELYGERMGRYGLGWADNPLKLRHPRVNGRPDRSQAPRDMVFADAARAGAYAGRYLSGGQLERFVALGLPMRAMWVSPVLQQLSGWSMARCRWVRQGWRIRAGTWTARTWYGTPQYPGWWHRPDDRAWVLAVLGAT